MFKNSKEYLKEINNTNRLDVRDDFFTFNEYEKSFYFRLIEHLDYYVDNTHIDFIEEELFMMKRTYEIIKNIQIIQYMMACIIVLDLFLAFGLNTLLQLYHELNKKHAHTFL